jgi:UDP-N-acetyl-D-mannosaminuronate dehydrogenase
LFTPAELRSLKSDVVDLDSEAAAGAEAIVVQAWHRDFRSLDWRRFKRLRVVLDGRGAVDADAVRKAGATYLAVGASGVRARSPK